MTTVALGSIWAHKHYKYIDAKIIQNIDFDGERWIVYEIRHNGTSRGLKIALKKSFLVTFQHPEPLEPPTEPPL